MFVSSAMTTFLAKIFQDDRKTQHGAETDRRLGEEEGNLRLLFLLCLSLQASLHGAMKIFISLFNFRHSSTKISTSKVWLTKSSISLESTVSQLRTAPCNSNRERARDLHRVAQILTQQFSSNTQTREREKSVENNIKIDGMKKEH
jgi:hypothetical protein